MIAVVTVPCRAGGHFPPHQCQSPGWHRGLAKLKRLCMNHHSEHRRLEEAVRIAAEQRGIPNGNPLAEPPKLGSINFELSALDLYLDLPQRLRVADSDLAHAMCRAALFAGQVDDRRHCAPMTPPKPEGHPAIARANRAAVAHRARQRGPRA